MIGKISAIVVDIDGTITDENLRLSLNAIKALRRAEERGYPVILASGNTLPVMYGLRMYLGFSGAIIAENGCVVEYKDRVEVLGRQERAREAMEVLKKMYGARELFTNRWRMAEVGLYASISFQDVQKVAEEFGLKAENTGFAYHISEEGMSKYEALKVAARLMNIEVDSALAIGDGENDLSLLKNLNRSATHSMAPESVKKVAKYVAKARYGDAIEEILRYYGVL